MCVQVERVTQEVPFTRAHCRLLPDEEEVAAAEATAEHVLEDAPPGAPLLTAMAAHAAAAAAAATAAAQVCGACARRLVHAERCATGPPCSQGAEKYMLCQWTITSEE